ncbi:MAG: ABC transporter ATP-binding protein, partial [Clostridia bacterium]
LRIELALHIHRLQYNVFTQVGSGVMESHLSADVGEIDNLITSGAISMLIDIFKLISIVITIFTYSIAFGALSAVIIPLVFVVLMFARKKLYTASVKSKATESQLNDIVVESVENLNTIKSYRVYPYQQDRFGKVLEKNYHYNRSVNFYDAFFSPLVQIIKSVIIVVIVLLCAKGNSVAGMTVGGLIGAIDLFSNLFQPIDSFGTELQTVQKSMAAIHRIDDFFALDEDNKSVITPTIKETTLEDTSVRQQRADTRNSDVVIEFLNVGFSYDGVTKVLSDFNLKVGKGEHINLVGESGAGKSTIMKLAYGLIKPTEGSVKVCGYDAYALTEAQRDKLFGIVYQDCFFSGGTVYEEVTLRAEGITREKVMEVLGKVGLSRVKSVDQRLEITDYSTGELSLFNIARAIITDREILFLDEMNAKLDNISANKIIETVNAVARDKTVLSINHYGSKLSNSRKVSIKKP